MLWLLLTISIHHIKKNLMRIEKLEENNLHLNINKFSKSSYEEISAVEARKGVNFDIFGPR